MKELSTRQLFKIYQCQYIYRIIDCREINEYEAYHIKDSINVPFKMLITKPYLFLNKNYEYYVICKNGCKSKIVCMLLNQMGYNLVNIVGGIDVWPGVLVESKRCEIN